MYLEGDLGAGAGQPPGEAEAGDTAADHRYPERACGHPIEYTGGAGDGPVDWSACTSS